MMFYNFEHFFFLFSIVVIRAEIHKMLSESQTGKTQISL